MSLEDEARTLRSRVAELADALDRLDSESSDGNPAMLVQTVAVGTYPTAANKFFAAHPVDPGGPEGEGNTISATVGGGIVYLANLGSAVPPAGTKLLARSINGRWVGVYNG